MKDEPAGRTERGWDGGRKAYTCLDSVPILVPRRTASLRDPDEAKIVPRSGIVYGISKKEPRIAVSGAEFSRDMRTVFGGPDDAKTIIFPSMVRTVRQEAFSKAQSLRAVILNEGLEVLGTDEYKADGTRYFGVFEESALEYVMLPSTLKKIEYNAFKRCQQLKLADFPEGLEYIGKSSFSETGLGSVEFPASLKTICQGSFCLCRSLERAKFGEGLEALGTDDYPPKEANFSLYNGVFSESALACVDLPHTMKRIEYNTFKGCTRLKSIKLPERLEYIGKYCFKGSALEGVCLPPLLKTINEYTFCKCEKLRHVTFASES